MQERLLAERQVVDAAGKVRTVRLFQLDAPAYNLDDGHTWLWKPAPSEPIQPGRPVTIHGKPILAPGEDYTATTPQKTIPWAEWLATHADYGLAVDGSRLED